MKKLFLAGAALLAFTAASAQADGTKFGIKGGVQFTNFAGDGDWNGKTGFYVGGLVDLAVAENFHIQPELLFSMEGAEGDTPPNDVDFGISYLRIPVMLKYYVMEGFNLQVGPEIAFKIATAEEAVDEAITSTDFGLGAGLGYEMASGLMFDVRYNLGLSNITEGDGDLKNTGIQLGLGYRF